MLVVTASHYRGGQARLDKRQEAEASGKPQQLVAWKGVQHLQYQREDSQHLEDESNPEKLKWLYCNLGAHLRLSSSFLHQIIVILFNLGKFEKLIECWMSAAFV